jgi:hypothetical protein
MKDALSISRGPHICAVGPKFTTTIKNEKIYGIKIRK